MATGRKKCICQICTCGKHICPHRKKAALLLKEVQNGKHVRVEGVGDAAKKREEIDGKENREFLKDSAANISQDTGKNQESWSAKQVPKTLSMKPPDNLKHEGPHDLTTIHQQDFTKKLHESDVFGTPDIIDEAYFFGDHDKSVWNKKQIPKTLPIKNPDNLKHTGQADFNTTHGTSYIDLTSIEDTAKRDIEMEGEDGRIRKPKRPRPKTSLKPEGHFQTESLYQQDFTPRRVEFSPRHRPSSNLKSEGEFEKQSLYNKDFTPRHMDRSPKLRPPTNLKVEGPMLFDTTSLDYKVLPKDASSEEYEEAIENLKRPRPQSQIRIPPEPLAADTTAMDFIQWNVDKPHRWKPADNLKQIGESELVDEKQLLEQIKNERYKEDVKMWNVKRPIVSKPASNLKPEGSIDFMTTHNSDYITKKVEAEAEVIENIIEAEHEVAEAQETIEQPFHIVPVEDIAIDDQSLAPEPEFKMEEPEPTPDIVDRVEASPDIVREFVTEDANSDEAQYLTWDQVRPMPIRPHSNLRQCGNMEFSTTNRSEFITRPMEKLTGFRPRTTTKITGELQTVTTNQAMFGNVDGEKVIPIRPKSNLHIENGTFSDETTSAREFQPWRVERATPIVHKSTLAQEGSMEFSTTHHREFEAKDAEKVTPIRPKTNNKVYEEGGKFEGMTTSRFMHPRFETEKVSSIRPQPNLHVENGMFSGDTTNRSEFQPWRTDRPSPITPRDNLHGQGDFDFTTTHRTQFGEKAIHRSRSLLRQQGSLKQEGEMDFTTSSQKEFGRPRSTEHAMDEPLTDRSSFRISQRNKEKVRYEDHLKLENASFSDETTNRREFVYRSADRSEPIRPKPNLSQEGGFDFTTSNKTDFGEKMGMRPMLIRPQTMTKPTTGEFDGSTTNNMMFKAPDIGMLRQRISEGIESRTDAKMAYHSDALKQDGQMQFETTSRKEFSEKSTEQPIPIRPRTTTRIEGDLDATTTNQVMFPNHVLERVQPIRQKDNLMLEKGKFSDETTSKREFKQWVKSPLRSREVKVIKPLRAAGVPTQKHRESQVDVTGSVSEPPPDEKETEKAEISSKGETYRKHMEEENEKNRASENAKSVIATKKTGDRTLRIARGEVKISEESTVMPKERAIQRSKAEVQVVTIPDSVKERKKTFKQEELDESGTKKKILKRYKPTDNLILEKVPFDADSTTRIEYRKWDANRASSKRRSPVLKQEGDMRFTTTANDYSKKEAGPSETRIITHVRTRKPQENLKQMGTMEFATTNQTVYVGNVTPKTRNLRPKSTLRLGSEEQHPIIKSLKTTSNGDITTTARASYQGIVVERTRTNRPSTSQKVGEGHFEGKSTTQTVFTGPRDVAKTRSFKPDSSHALTGREDFQGNTTYRCSYEAAKSTRHCPVLDLERSAKFRFKEEVNGHRFYLPLVQG